MKNLLFAALMLVSTTTFASDLTDKLQSASVTVKAGGAQGSGSLVTRTIEGTDYTFVLTAGHVIAEQKTYRKVNNEGKETKVIEFSDINIVQEFQQDGRRVGETNVICRVLAYSDADYGEDLAIMVVRKTNFTKATTDFYLDEKIPDIGTELYHVGSLKGQFGSNSLTTGILSQTGRVFILSNPSGTIFDQTTATAFPGSSGGGMYRKADGLHLGVLVRGSGEGFNFIVPARRLNAWCKLVKADWLVDPKAKLPTKDELSKMSPADQPDVSGGGRGYSEDGFRYPFMINCNDLIPNFEEVFPPAP